MVNKFSKYCGDYYKYGNVFLKNKYIWLCPCAENPNLYPIIRNSYRKDYQITKNILLEEERLQRLRFIYSVEALNYVSNSNRLLKRGTNSSEIASIYSFYKRLK